MEPKERETKEGNEEREDEWTDERERDTHERGQGAGAGGENGTGKCE